MQGTGQIRTCLNCGGAILPQQATGWGGPICICSVPRDPAMQQGSLTYVPAGEAFQTILTQILDELKTINTSLDVLVERGNS